MRTRLVAVAAALLCAGCYAPKVKNRGFSCVATQADACPAGFACINGLCDDGSGGAPPAPVADMAQGNGGGGGGGGGGDGSNDMAHATHDMSMPPPVDMSMPAPPDMASSCVAKGGDCTYHNDSICCSKYCIYSSNTCR